MGVSAQTMLVVRSTEITSTSSRVGEVCGEHWRGSSPPEPILKCTKIRRAAPIFDGALLQDAVATAADQPGTAIGACGARLKLCLAGVRVGPTNQSLWITVSSAAISIGCTGLCIGEASRSTHTCVTAAATAICVDRTRSRGGYACGGGSSTLHGRRITEVAAAVCICGAVLPVGHAHVCGTTGAIRVAHASAAFTVRSASVAIAFTLTGVADKCALSIRGTQTTTALVGDGTALSIGDAGVEVTAEASLDAKYGSLTGAFATATIVGPCKAAVAYFTGGFGPLDGGATADCFAREEFAHTGSAWVLTR